MCKEINIIQMNVPKDKRNDGTKLLHDTRILVPLTIFDKVSSHDEVGLACSRRIDCDDCIDQKETFVRRLPCWGDFDIASKVKIFKRPRSKSTNESSLFPALVRSCSMDEDVASGDSGELSVLSQSSTPKAMEDFLVEDHIALLGAELKGKKCAWKIKRHHRTVMAGKSKSLKDLKRKKEKSEKIEADRFGRGNKEHNRFDHASEQRNS